MSLNEIIKKQLLKIVDDLDSHESEVDPNDVDDLFMVLASKADRNTKMSKYQACKYLNVSRATFDSKVANGLIPKGRKQAGFKELFWIKRDLDTYLKNNS